MVLAGAAVGWPVASPVRASALTFCDPAEGPPTNARFEAIGAVALNSGGFELQVADLPGRTTASEFIRAYFSFDTRNTSLGPAWQHNFDVRLRLAGGGDGDMLFTLPDGAVERFQKAWGNTPVSGRNRGYRILDQSIDGTWTVSDDAITWHFTSEGDLSSVDAPNGYAEVWYRDGDAAQIVDATGPTIALEYAADARLERVATLRGDARLAEYAYDAIGRLSTVVRSDGGTEAYTYDGDSRRIATISIDDTTVLALSYDENGRVVSEQDADGLRDGQAVEYEYEDLEDGWIRTTVRYAESLLESGWRPIEQSLHDADGRLREMTFQPTSDEPLLGRYDYDAENRRLLVQDPCPPPDVEVSTRRPFVGLVSFVIWIVALLLGF